ncbi:hypothetical protein [Natroniella sp. ANB-PHB2]|uniref:hypothetical protein n=1 Tax=Natroniella sp. ANB-PHB2 TaxID=3384444 RepID=UPI0038D3E740
MKLNKEEIGLIFKLIFWPLVLMFLVMLLLTIGIYFQEKSNIFNLTILLVQLIIIVMTIVNKTKAFWYIFNQLSLFLGISIILVISAYVYGQSLSLIILGSTISILLGYINIKKKKKIFIERGVERKKIDLENRKINIIPMAWPNLSTSKIKEKIDELLIPIGVPLAVVIQRSRILMPHGDWLSTIAGWMALFAAGSFLWKIKWILDWQKECDCIIRTDYEEHIY